MTAATRVTMSERRTCRGCGSADLIRILDLGRVPAADNFPLADSPVTARESAHTLAMDLCELCGLAQLAADDTVIEEPRGVEPQALRDQAEDAVAHAAAAGLLTGKTVREFGSPHGGTWIPLLAERNFTEIVDAPADVVLDSFGIMHEPDQKAAFARRAAATAPDGVLLLQFQPLGSIVAQRQWTALRHGHFAYYTLGALQNLLAEAGMRPVRAFEFDLYGGTILLAVRHTAAIADDAQTDVTLSRLLREEAAAKLTTPDGVATLASAPREQAAALRAWAHEQRLSGGVPAAYGAASRAVALFALAHLHTGLISCVADASPAKQGRRMPGTNIPIVAPEQLAETSGAVFLTLPDLLGEVEKSVPALRGRLVVEDAL